MTTEIITQTTIVRVKHYKNKVSVDLHQNKDYVLNGCKGIILKFAIDKNDELDIVKIKNGCMFRCWVTLSRSYKANEEIKFK